MELVRFLTAQVVSPVPPASNFDIYSRRWPRVLQTPEAMLGGREEMTRPTASFAAKPLAEDDESGRNDNPASCDGVRWVRPALSQRGTERRKA
jgi:hypothetical protein